jgi:hypothetical protein
MGRNFAILKMLILFGSTTLLTGMTGISLHMPWPQSHGSFSQKEQLFFVTDQTPCHAIFLKLIFLRRKIPKRG